MANSIFVVFIAVFVLQIGTGKDIRWIKNSNWNNVDNWSLGRLPCKGDIASFSQVTPLSGQKPVIYFNSNSTVRRLVLPRNGRIVLKPSITIQLTANESCEISSNTVPMAAADSTTGGGEVNNFIGVRANRWECPENWATDDNSSVTHAPCGSDVPVFPSGSTFSYITSAMGSIFVNSVSLGTEEPPNFDPYSDELLLNLSVNPDCQNNPDLCPCIQVDNNCNVLASTALPTSLSTMTPTTSSASLTVSSIATSSFATTMQSFASSSSPSSMTSSLLFTPSPPPVISPPGNVGVTSSTSVPIPDISGPIGPIGTGGIANNDGITNNDDSGDSSAAMIGAIVGVIVVLLILVVIIVIVIIFVRKRRYRETKHTHLEEDDHGFATKESGTAAYDNPVYERNLNTPSVDLENPLF